MVPVPEVATRSVSASVRRTSRFEPHVLQKLLCRWSVPWIQFHHFRNEIPVQPCKFIIFTHTERKPLFVLLNVGNCTHADFEAFRVRDLLETFIERPEASNLLDKHPKAIMFIIKYNICGTADVPVSAKYEADQLRKSV